MCCLLQMLLSNDHHQMMHGLVVLLRSADMDQVQGSNDSLHIQTERLPCANSLPSFARHHHGLGWYFFSHPGTAESGILCSEVVNRVVNRL